nr:MAG TPA: hypothetical protein [Caudoviricetes sp.]
MDETITVLSLVIIAIFVANLVLAYKMSEVAAMKGYGEEIHAFAWCIWLGIFGYIYVLSLPDKVTQEQNQRIIELLEKNVGYEEDDELPEL